MKQDESDQRQQVAALASSLVEAIRESELDHAEQLLEELNVLNRGTEEYLVFPVLIAIQRGFITEALQYLNTLGEDQSHELKALCLNILGDPTWHYHATLALESEDASVRTAMRQLLYPDDESIEAERA